MRRPFAGSARWATGIADSLAVEPDIAVLPWLGPRRLTWRNPGRKLANWAIARMWYDIELPRLARRQRADVLFMPVNLVARPCGIPQVVAVLDVNFVTAPGTYDRAFSSYAIRQFRRSVRDADRVITISKFSRTQIATVFGLAEERIDVVYPGLNEPGPVSDGRPLDRPYALYVGATEPHKNVRLAVEAWRRTPSLDLALAIVGQPGRNHAEILRVADGDPRVVVVGAVADDALDQWYGHAQVFVFPSRAEGFGFPPLEAMQRGVPVVAARAGSLPEVLGEAALFHDPDSAEELAARVQQVIVSQALRRQLGEAGIARAARFTWAASSGRLAEILRSVAPAETRG